MEVAPRKKSKFKSIVVDLKLTSTQFYKKGSQEIGFKI